MHVCVCVCVCTRARVCACARAPTALIVISSLHTQSTRVTSDSLPKFSFPSLVHSSYRSLSISMPRIHMNLSIIVQKHFCYWLPVGTTNSKTSDIISSLVSYFYAHPCMPWHPELHTRVFALSFSLIPIVADSNG